MPHLLVYHVPFRTLVAEASGQNGGEDQFNDEVDDLPTLDQVVQRGMISLTPVEIVYDGRQQ